jgi:hypothetical protein
MSLNAEWHKKNRMPQRATLSQRVKWHLEHAKECGCRSIPKNIVDAILERFDSPGEVREMIKGRFEVADIEGMTIGRAAYEPGWKWSEHVGPALGQSRCTVEHVGYVVSGNAVAAYDDGRIDPLREGKRFYVPPEPHDSWVVGDAPYVSLHFVGADRYSK